MNKTSNLIIGVVLLVIVGFAAMYFTGDSLRSENTATNSPSIVATTETNEVVLQLATTTNNNETNEITDMETVTTATMQTNKGAITIELYGAQTPKTVENFAMLAKQGFYDGVKFHRVIPDFMIQGGDPLTKDDSLQGQWGTGGPGYAFEDEFVPELSNVTGTIAMANSGPGTNGSQFFINVSDNVFLDGKHTVFGKVTAGYENVEAISKVDKNQRDVPNEPIVIEGIVLE
jgi:cyclophilin family peptidyl-prolyl cis-trans isomerase